MEKFFNPAKKIKAKNIVILFKAGIGNMLLFLPALKLLRKSFPEAKLILICAPRGIDEILKRIELFDKVEIYSQSKIFKVLKLGWNLKKQYQPDIVISAQPGITGSLIGFLSGAKKRVGFRYKMGLIDNTDFLYTDAVFYDRTKHEVERYLDLIKALNGQEEFLVRESIGLKLDRADHLNAEKILQKNQIQANDFLIGVHPGSFKDQKFKRWPAEYWAELCNLLAKSYQAKVLILGGKEEEEIGKEIKNREDKSINLIGQTSLLSAAAIIQRCKFFVSNDSGLMHLAASVGTPVFGIFGPTSPIKNKPWTKMAWVIQLGLKCQPCYQEFRDWKGCEHERIRCLQDLHPNQVLQFIYSRRQNFQ